MEKLIFTCQTVTPLVMNGAYGDQPELRPPGIKASLRFWWRALHGHLTLDRLREQESAIFGNTKGRSKVLIRLEDHIDASPIHPSLLPHKGGSNAAAFPPNETFKIRLDFDEKVIKLEEIKNLFILACTLGGWGKRSRRGFGSVSVTEIEIKGSVDSTFKKMPENIDEVYDLLPKTYFKKPINTIYSNFQKNEPYPYLKSIEFGKEFPNENSILRAIGSSSSATKRNYEDSWNYKNSMGHTSKRFASPVWTSVIKRGDKFYPLFTTLNIALPDNKFPPREASDIQEFYKSHINP